MNITFILLICVFSNLGFVFLGYKLGASKQIIEITKGDSVQYVQAAKQEPIIDEPAYILTPEDEARIDAAYKSSKLVRE
jgi:hypothetical protein